MSPAPLAWAACPAPVCVSCPAAGKFHSFCESPSGEAGVGWKFRQSRPAVGLEESQAVARGGGGAGAGGQVPVGGCCRPQTSVLRSPVLLCVLVGVAAGVHMHVHVCSSSAHLCLSLGGSTALQVSQHQASTLNPAVEDPAVPGCRVGAEAGAGPAPLSFRLPEPMGDLGKYC